ncbi:pheromone receptor transcription factor-like [Xenia sp. Carnegie-2017]|uniref:pheromone receptor transcription factor-like n=1 Tax=Xenia sp. Carnegie-2017 TaxID=2897299 RepID=UPI001F0390F1|nr:pheromone receptor transcription factor-like [Xenia sp. Carnegie-2017]
MVNGLMDYFLNKSRDSCQPEQTIEPSASDNDDEDDDDDDDRQREQPPQKRENVFVPIRNRKKKRESDVGIKVLKLLESMIENDPTKELIEFMKEDAAKSRQNEMELIKILSNQHSREGYAPVMHHQNHQQGYFQAAQLPQHWQQPAVPMVSQTPPPQQHWQQPAVTMVPQTPPPQQHWQQPAVPLVPQTPPSGQKLPPSGWAQFVV